jgi:hypothetical protein
MNDIETCSHQLAQLSKERGERDATLEAMECDINTFVALV